MHVCMLTGMSCRNEQGGRSRGLSDVVGEKPEKVTWDELGVSCGFGGLLMIWSVIHGGKEEMFVVEKILGRLLQRTSAQKRACCFYHDMNSIRSLKCRMSPQ